MMHAIQTSTKTQITLAVHSHTHGVYIYITKNGSYPLILPRSLDLFFRVSSIVSLFCES